MKLEDGRSRCSNATAYIYPNSGDQLCALEGSSNSNKIEDALAKAQIAQSELNKTPTDNQAALGNIEGAVNDIQAAVDAGDLGAATGTQLMDDLVGISKQLAENAINTAIDELPDSDAGKIDTANEKLAEGDGFRDEGKFKDAASKYKDALSEAEGALP